jgi:HAD superfamily hydrolase (TIGR01509 family)
MRQPASARFDLIIFDNDGVLVDSEPVANRVLSGLLTEYGFPCTAEDCIAQFMGRSVPQVRAIVEERLGRTLPADLEACYAEELYPRFRQCLQPIPGIADALGTIEQTVCVASSGTHERIRLTLGYTGLWDRFGGRVFSAQDVARGKPAPDLFLHAAASLGADPRRCAVVEDSPAGVTAANAAGMTSFGFARLVPAERLAHATGAVFSDMRMLPALIQAAATRTRR